MDLLEAHCRNGKPRNSHGQKDGILPILSAAPATDAFAI